MSDLPSSSSPNPTITLSLVIACYNESKVFRESFQTIKRVLDYSGFTYEILFVDDMSSDETRTLIQEACKDSTVARWHFHEKNMGRGATVTDGFRRARGEFVGFIDFDLATPPWYIPEIISQLRGGADMVLARRIYKVRPRIIHRWILSRGYHWLMSRTLSLSLGDTETGCKFFNRTKILPVLDEIKDPHWFWDTEICVRAFFRGLTIKEVPTLYIRRPETGTTVKIVRDTWNYFCNLMAFRKEVALLRKQTHHP